MSFKDILHYYPSDGERAVISIVSLADLAGAVPACMWLTGLMMNGK
ncbi:MAG: hypothetical protein UX62_C0044G0010 [Microgenomates group bacterium GW2011_GWA2_46_7]|nr:MAG: hypothetical protein UX62_C0044G0010 [Microgenomates group bacterium GW2011_GWA2_46_7]